MLSTVAAGAQPAPQYPLDDKLANEPAPWAAPGKWGKHGNWGRWGEDDKRGMLNYITPEMVAQAAALVKRGKVYALGEELTNDVPRVITPARVGIQIIQENDGYDRVGGQVGRVRPEAPAGCRQLHLHAQPYRHAPGHVRAYLSREFAIQQHAAAEAVGTAHGDAASVVQMVGRGVLLDVAAYKGADPLPVDYWITAEDLQNTAKAQNVEIRKGDILLVRTGWRKTWDEPDSSGRLDAAHTKWHQPQPGVGPDCLKFLNEMEIVAIGSDNAAVEWGFPGEPAITPKGIRLSRPAAARRFHLEPRRLHHGDPQPRRAGQGSGVRVLLHPWPAAAERRDRGAGQSAGHPVAVTPAGPYATGDTRMIDGARAPRSILRDVKKSFPMAGGIDLEVLDVEHLTLPAATCTVLRGRSGSGKTTLLNLIAGVALPSAGTIRVDDTDVLALSEARRDRFRARHVGYVFQSFNLLAAFSAIENVMLAMTFADVVPKRLQRQRATELLARLGLAARLAHKPQHLSRGEQQRVAIARALANDPPIILADEPCASLDARTAQRGPGRPFCRSAVRTGRRC